MGRLIPDDFIEKVRESTDIVDVIGDYVQLKHKGNNWVGLSPFSNERNPSFNVNPSKGIYKCFSSGKGGDVFSFLMEHEKVGFSEAVELLAGRLGMELPAVDRDEQQDKARERLVYCLQWAREYFVEQLHAENGHKALEYLKGRALDDKTIEKFSLGWAPAERGAFKKAALGHGISEEDLVTVGLLGRSEENPETYERFRGRVIFPVNERNGRTVGFGGRVLGDGEPKYLNSPETPLFHKGSIFYGLDNAAQAIRRLGRAIVVEGYMDLISLSCRGVENVVAPMGTALTAEQAVLLSRYSHNVFLLYDADNAGLKATFRSGDEILGAGGNVRVISLPNGMDPDDFIREKGPEEFSALLSKAPDFLDRKIEIIGARLNLELPADRQSAADKLLESVARCRDLMTRDLYLKKTAEFLDVPEDILGQRLTALESKRKDYTGVSPAATQNGRGAGTVSRPKKKAAAETKIVAVCIQHPEYIPEVGKVIEESDFSDERLQAIYVDLKKLSADGVRQMAEALYQVLPGSAELVGKLRSELVSPPDEVVNACWRWMKIARIERKIDELKQKSELRDRVEIQREIVELIARKNKLHSEISSRAWEIR